MTTSNTGISNLNLGGGSSSDNLRKTRVGYRNPPEATRFRPGQSGNPRGRPKGSQNLTTVLERILRETVTIRENGRSKRVSKLEYAIQQLTKKAIAGNLRAVQQLMALVRSAEAQAPQENHNPSLPETDHKVLQHILQRVQAANNNIQGDNNDSDNQSIQNR